MMGLKDEIFYLSWFIAYALQVGFSLNEPPYHCLVSKHCDNVLKNDICMI